MGWCGEVGRGCGRQGGRVEVDPQKQSSDTPSTDIEWQPLKREVHILLGCSLVVFLSFGYRKNF